MLSSSFRAFVVVVLAASAASAAVPTLPETFSVPLRQFSAAGKLLLDEVLVHDLPNNRARTQLSGPSFPNPVTQIDRFDVGVFYEFVHFANGSYRCEAQHVSGSVGTFFDVPDTAVLVDGHATVNGYDCEVWQYNVTGNSFKFAVTKVGVPAGVRRLLCRPQLTLAPVCLQMKSFWAPVRITAVGSWYADYNASAFDVSTPPLSTYATPPGVPCPFVSHTARRSSPRLLSAKL